MSNKHSDFEIIAHRGDSDSAPENTWAAFDLALCQGFAGVETDCQLTADGTCVIIHDELLDRTTNSAGPVAESTWEDVRRLDAGSWFNHRFTGERVPLAEDFLRRYRGRMHLHLELKSSQAGLAEAVAAALDRTGWLWDLRARQRKSTFGAPGLTITSFHLSQLQESLKVLDDEVVALAKSCGIRQICPRADALTPEAVKLARTQGLSVRAWGVKNTKLLLHVLNCGAEGATVNWPRRARDAVRMSAPPWMWIRLPGRETRAVASAAAASFAAFILLKFLSRTA